MGVSGAMGLPSERYFWQSGAVLSSKRVSSMLEAGCWNISKRKERAAINTSVLQVP